MGKNQKRNKKKRKQKTNSHDVTEKQDSPDDVSAQEVFDEDVGETANNESSSKSLKRDIQDDDDSDTEEKPRKKKKKKQQGQGADGEKKGKKSIRQIKRDKYLQRQADAQAVAKDELKSQCLVYLSQWKHNRQYWKFMKAKQVWLYKNKFSPSLVPNENWPVFLEYFESAQGNIKNMLLTDANNIIKQMDEWTEKQKSQEAEKKENDEEEETDLAKPDETAYKRARDIIQCLQE